MNKNIKKIVAIALAIGAVSASAPATNVNFLTTKAYAVNDNEEDYLDSLNLYDEDEDDIQLYKNNTYTSKVDDDDVDESTTYYAKTSSDIVSIDIDGPRDEYVKVFTGTASSSKGYDVGDEIDLSEDSAITTLTIKVYGDKPDSDMRYGDNDDYNVLSTYRVKVENTNYDEGKDNDNIYLERLSVNSNMINLSSSTTKYVYNVDSNMKKVTIRATPEDDDYDVKIDGKMVHSSDNYKRTVDLDEGTNEFEIEIEDDDKDKTYTLVINRGTPTATSTIIVNTKNPEDYGNLYLEKLVIEGKVISLSKSNINYTSNVSSDRKSVTIQAVPENDNYTVKVKGDEVYEDDDYKTTINLNQGLNPINIELKSKSGGERVYTLNAIRGSISSNSDGTSTQPAIGANANQWVQTNGLWQYNDVLGNPVKNTWVQNYYLQYDGNMANGWLNYNGSWYYLGSDGAKKTGWQWVDRNWYHLDSEGKIQTGWFKDLNGKYYYLNSYGAMTYNTTIDGYKLGTDGAWTGR